MSNLEINELLKKRCEEALAALHKLKSDEYVDVQSKLELLISYWLLFIFVFLK